MNCQKTATGERLWLAFCCMILAPSGQRDVCWLIWSTPEQLPHGSLAWENVIFADTEKCHLVTNW
jgi:hypothetical protein